MLDCVFLDSMHIYNLRHEYKGDYTSHEVLFFLNSIVIEISIREEFLKSLGYIVLQVFIKIEVKIQYNSHIRLYQ